MCFLSTACSTLLHFILTGHLLDVFHVFAAESAKLMRRMGIFVVFVLSHFLEGVLV